MKIVKWILGLLLGVLVLGAAGVYAYFYVLHPKLRPAADLKAPASAEAVARGRYLATAVAGCMGCHTASEEDKPGDPLVPDVLGGGRDFGELPGFPGHIRAPNLTPDRDHGIGDWTDGEVVRAMREGVDRDGRPLFPIMPYPTYHDLLSDDDALAIVAYLRTLQPLASDPGPMEVSFPVSMFSRLTPRPVETPPPPAPPASDASARGRWLLRMASCQDCHTPAEKGKPIPGKDYAGGTLFKLPDGTDLYAPNITSDRATGIGAYTDEDLRRVLDEGVNKAGRKLYLMPWTVYRKMTDEDKRALIAALRAIPPVANLVPAPTSANR